MRQSVREASERTEHATREFIPSSDIVGSTVRASGLGDSRWRVLLDHHDELVRDHVEAAGGRVVKTTGDGSLCIFDGPARAIRCGQAIAGAVRDLGVEVRVGLHTAGV
jgi:class 3 adenylate cyclase